MRANHLRPAAVVAGVVFVVAAVAAASAWAGASKSSVAVPGNSLAATKTDCPRGTALVSQGFGTKNFAVDGSSSVVVRVDSHRSGRGLESRAVNFSEFDGVFDAYAYCSKLGKSVEVVRASKSFQAQTFGTVKARCPSGSHPVGGGFGSPGFSPTGIQPIALTSRRQGRAWLVEAIISSAAMRGGQAFGKVAAYAYCVPDAPKLSVSSRTRTVSPNGLKTIVATCPKGKRAVSGGFDGEITMAAQPVAGGAVISRRAKQGRAWKVRAVGVAETDAQETVYAYCAKR